MRVVPLVVAAVLAQAPATSLAAGDVLSQAPTPTGGLSQAPAQSGSPAAAPAGVSGGAPAPLLSRPSTGGRWGFALAGGFPDFATASVMFRPWSRLRLWAGPGWNYVAWGAQGGVALVPWSYWIAPVLSLEGGHFFRGNLAALADTDEGMSAVLRRVDYSYGTIALGLDLGSPRGFAFFLRAGLTYVSLATHDGATFESDTGSGASVRVDAPRVRGNFPSAKLGFQYWF